MALKPEEVMAIAQAYTDESIAGGGISAGKNCTIDSITDITGGHRVTYKWYLDNGTVQTTIMDVMDGAQGPQGPKGDPGQGAVDSVNGKTGDVTLDATDVGALPDDTVIPEKTSDLTNDSDFVSDADYVHTDNNYDSTAKGIVDGVTAALAAKADTADLAAVATSGSYADLTNKPAIPSALADLTDDATHRLVTDIEKTTWGDKQDVLTFDNAPTENSNNPVKSGGVYTANQNIYEVMGQNGAKNLLPNEAVTQTVNGITFTVNSDGSITANGTATTVTRFFILGSDSPVSFKSIEGKGPYKVSGVSGGDASNTYGLIFQGSNNGTSTAEACDLSDGEDIIGDFPYYRCYIVARENAVLSNVTFYPMIRLASDSDPTYQPYAMTNRQLTKELADIYDAVTQSY